MARTRKVPGTTVRTPGVTPPPAREHGVPNPILELQRSAGNLGVGRLLEPPVRRDFERLFSAPLGDVRVHTDEAAAASAEARGATAYTIGNQVVFGADRYAPDTSDGRTLLAHELAHVVQQARGVARGVTTPPGAVAEQEASRAAGAVAQGLTPQVAGATGIGVARNEDEEQKKSGGKKSGGKKGGGKKSGGKKPPPEPEIVGEYQGVPVKRYPPQGKPPKQQVYVKPPVDDLPEGTQGTAKAPPGSGKVNPGTEAGIWAHENFEKLEKILKPEAERLTSERLPEGLRKEVEVPDPRLPPGKRPRMDRVNDATAEIIEIKPESLRQQGEIEAKAYAEWMNRFEKRADGRQWVGRCVTYDEKKVRAFLREKGYTAPDPEPEEPAGKAKAKPGKAKAKPGKAKGQPAKAKAQPPKVRAKAGKTVTPGPEPAPVKPAPVKPAPVAPAPVAPEPATPAPVKAAPVEVTPTPAKPAASLPPVKIGSPAEAVTPVPQGKAPVGEAPGVRGEPSIGTARGGGVGARGAGGRGGIGGRGVGMRGGFGYGAVALEIMYPEMAKQAKAQAKADEIARKVAKYDKEIDARVEKLKADIAKLQLNKEASEKVYVNVVYEVHHFEFSVDVYLKSVDVTTRDLKGKRRFSTVLPEKGWATGAEYQVRREVDEHTYSVEVYVYSEAELKRLADLTDDYLKQTRILRMRPGDQAAAEQLAKVRQEIVDTFGPDVWVLSL